MHTLEARRVHEDLEHRQRLRQVGDLRRQELEREVGLGRAVRTTLEPVGAQGRLDEGEELAQDAVLVEIGDLVERGLDRRHLRRARGLAIARERRVEARAEELQQRTRELGIGRQRLLHVGETEGERRLAHVAGVGA